MSKAKIGPFFIQPVSFLKEPDLMHECLDTGEHVGLFLGVVDRMQHGQVLVGFQGVLSD